MTTEEAIKVIEELMIACTPNSKYYKVGRRAIEAIRRSTWISTSDRNPSSDGRYLVSTDGFDIEIAYYQNGAWHKARQIIAWMPLPKSYREGDHEN